MGSKLVTKEAVVAGDFDSIRGKVKECLDWIEESRG